LGEAARLRAADPPEDDADAGTEPETTIERITVA
jgi:hypothetical protein